MSRTLCIIDMQEEFRASSDPHTILGVCKEIRKATRYNWHVLLVEYGSTPHKRSLKQIRDLLKGHRRCYRVVKHNDDGSDEMIKAAAKHNVDISTMRVCGVNADSCVKKTVKGLLDKVSGMRVELVKNGCNSDGANRMGVVSDLREIKGRRRNVKLI